MSNWPPAARIAAIVGTIVCVTLVNVVLFIAVIWLGLLPPREEPRTIEVIVRSVFAGDVVHEEHILVDGTSNDPVELTLVLNERDQVEEYL